MPRKYAKKRFNKKGSKSSVKKFKNKKRRLSLVLDAIDKDSRDRTDAFVNQNNFGKSNKYIRGRNPYDNLKPRRSVIGRGAPDAASGAAGGFKVGRVKRMNTVLAKRKASIINVMADTQYPILKNHQLGVVSQIDWASSAQAVVFYDCGYNTAEIENMLTQAQSASYINTSALVPVSTTDTLTNQRMDYFSKTTKFNFKNTCTHTVYMEIRAYKCKGYHSFSVQDSWNQAMANDQMVQNSSSYGTEETLASIGKRPDMRYAELNVRWKPHTEATFKCTLEPGQETSYTYVQPGSRFDQQRFNVQQGSFANPVDVDYCPSTTQLLVFCRAEMVADSLDTDVSFGSGHLAVNKEEWKSWCCVPFTKPRQESYQNNWGTIVEANELDLNQNRLLTEVYSEQV